MNANGTACEVVIDGETFYLIPDILFLFFGKPRYAPLSGVSFDNRKCAKFTTGEPLFRKIPVINMAGIQELCAKHDKEVPMQGNLQDLIENANRKAGKSRQKVFAKKVYLHQTDKQIIDQLCDRAGDVLAAYFKNEGTAALRDAVKGLQEAVNIAKRP